VKMKVFRWTLLTLLVLMIASEVDEHRVTFGTVLVWVFLASVLAYPFVSRHKYSGTHRKGNPGTTDYHAPVNSTPPPDFDG